MARVYIPFSYDSEDDKKIFVERVLRIPFTDKIFYRFPKKEIDLKYGYFGIYVHLNTRWFGGSFVFYYGDKKTKIITFKPGKYRVFCNMVFAKW